MSERQNLLFEKDRDGEDERNVLSYIYARNKRFIETVWLVAFDNELVPVRGSNRKVKPENKMEEEGRENLFHRFSLLQISQRAPLGLPKLHHGSRTSLSSRPPADSPPKPVNVAAPHTISSNFLRSIEVRSMYPFFAIVLPFLSKRLPKIKKNISDH